MHLLIYSNITDMSISLLDCSFAGTDDLKKITIVETLDRNQLIEQFIRFDCP